MMTSGYGKSDMLYASGEVVRYVTHLTVAVGSSEKRQSNRLMAGIGKGSLDVENENCSYTE